MSKTPGLEAVSKTAYKALYEGGERVSQMRFRWDVSAECACPKVVTVFGRPSSGKGKYIVVAPGTKHPLEVELTTPCRQCSECLQRRSRIWAARAIAECEQSSRTWFGTLTLSPEAHFKALCAVRARSDERLSEFDQRPDSEKFHLVVNEIGKEITLFLKRVRKNSDARLRYCLVAEQHKSGLPHFHALIHERSLPVRHAVLKEAWRLGFTNFKLVTNGKFAAYYVAKYLSKSSLTRVRASVNYGDGSNEPVDFDRLNDLLAVTPGEPRVAKQAPGSFQLVETHNVGNDDSLTPLSLGIRDNLRVEGNGIDVSVN